MDNWLNVTSHSSAVTKASETILEVFLMPT